HAGGGRQVAGDHDIGAEITQWKVAGEAVRGDFDVLPPAGIGCAWPRQLHRVPLAAQGVDDADDAILARAGDDGKAARHAADQRAAAGVVGVLAEHFEPARPPPRVQRRRRADHAVRLDHRRVHALLRFALGGIETARDQRRGQRGGVHGDGTVPARRRSTSAASARRERSSTGPRAGTALKRTPRRTARPTASGSSSSPRAERGTSRQASKIRASKRQQFMLISWCFRLITWCFRLKAEATGSWLPPLGGRSSLGFSTMPVRYPCWSTSMVAKDRTRSGGMLLDAIRSSTSNAGRPGSPSAARSRSAATG